MRPEFDNRYNELREVAPDLFEEFQDFEIDRLIQVMQEPVRAVDQCITKSRLKTLCIQLLAKNLALQAKLNKQIDAHA